MFFPLACIPSIPWAWFTVHEYDDLFAGKVSGRYFDETIPGLMRKDVDARVVFVELPQGFWKSFWYSSGWNQYFWSWWAYIPYWALFLPPLVLGSVLLIRDRTRRSVAAVLGLTVLAALAVFVYIGIITTGTQARVSFVGLSALAVLVAVGAERVRVPARFALPLLGVIGTLLAFRDDVIQVFY
jgi:hypothetical protein